MNYHTRKWIKPEDLNANHTLFGGKLLQWIDEEAALYAIIQLENPKTVPNYISEINFIEGNYNCFNVNFLFLRIIASKLKR